MPNPFYTPTQKSYAILIISQWFILCMMLIFAKLVWPVAFCASWWLITAPLWMPFLLFMLFVCLCVIIYGIKEDRRKMQEYLDDLENYNQQNKF